MIGRVLANQKSLQIQNSRHWWAKINLKCLNNLAEIHGNGWKARKFYVIRIEIKRYRMACLYVWNTVSTSKKIYASYHHCGLKMNMDTYIMIISWAENNFSSLAKYSHRQKSLISTIRRWRFVFDGIGSGSSV